MADNTNKDTRAIDLIDLTGDDADTDSPANDDAPTKAEVPGLSPRSGTSIYPASRNTRLLTQNLRDYVASVVAQSTPEKEKKERRPKCKYKRRVKDTTPSPMLTSPVQMSPMQISPIQVSPLDQFEYFSDLATETRVEIWRIAILAPRKLNITLDWSPYWERELNTASTATVFKASPLLSVHSGRGTLRACRESNEVAKEVLAQLQVQTPNGVKTVYFNPPGDTIVLDDSSLFTLILCSIRVPSNGPTVRDVQQSTSVNMLNFARNPFHGFEHVQNLQVIGKRHDRADKIRLGLELLLRTVLVQVNSLILPVDPRERSLIYHLKIPSNYARRTGVDYWPDDNVDIMIQEYLMTFASMASRETKEIPATIRIVDASD